MRWGLNETRFLMRTTDTIAENAYVYYQSILTSNKVLVLKYPDSATFGKHSAISYRAPVRQTYLRFAQFNTFNLLYPFSYVCNVSTALQVIFGINVTSHYLLTLSLWFFAISSVGSFWLFLRGATLLQFKQISTRNNIHWFRDIEGIWNISE